MILELLEQYYYNALFMDDLKEEYNKHMQDLDRIEQLLDDLERMKKQLNIKTKRISVQPIYDIMGSIIAKHSRLKKENKKILALLDQLQGKEKIVMYLHCVKGYKWEKIARELQLSGRQVHRYKNRAIANLSK
jgi:DNA-directed RNA polymerase specialized sigma24 family protein